MRCPPPNKRTKSSVLIYLLERGEQAFASFPIERGNPRRRRAIAASRSSRSVCIEPICSSNSWSSCSARRFTGPILSRSRIRRSSLTSTTSRGGSSSGSISASARIVSGLLSRRSVMRSQRRRGPTSLARLALRCGRALPAIAECCFRSPKRGVSFAQPVFHFRKTVRGLILFVSEPAIKSIRVVRCVSISFGRAASCSCPVSAPRRA